MMRLAALFLLCTMAAAAPAHPEVERIVAASEAPTGVVFEIVEGGGDSLAELMPRVAELRDQLQRRFPGLPVAVVSHGAEQFALLRQEASGPLASIHAAAEALDASGVEVQVCGAHAGWYGHAAEDFSAYVDVAPSGPARLNDYASLGFTLVRLSSGD